MFIIKAYLFTVVITMISEMIVVARSQLAGLPMHKHQLLCTIFSSFLPLGNLIVLTGNVIMMFMSRPKFIMNFIFAKDLDDQVKIRYEKDDKGEE